ncbi:hypothetical protein [Solimonas soli]|uniref:hypothetical protein n=1 Tax=Solimonas soli TaxID=413479 RepID=UPI00048878C3|nr:hypothetical protein [Solimonas soli]
MKPPTLFHAVPGLLAGLLLLLAGTALAASAATDAQRVPVPLTASARDAVGRLACDRYRQPAEDVGPAFRRADEAQTARVVHVSVLCAPHASVAGLPSRYRVNCQRRDAQWQCQEGREVLTVRTAFGEVAVEPGSYSREQAIQAVRAAAASNRYQAQVREALASGCGLYVDVTARMDEVVDLSCNSGHSFLISFWCPRGDCPRLLTMR